MTNNKLCDCLKILNIVLNCDYVLAVSDLKNSTGNVCRLNLSANNMIYLKAGALNPRVSSKLKSNNKTMEKCVEERNI